MATEHQLNLFGYIFAVEIHEIFAFFLVLFASTYIHNCMFGGCGNAHLWIVPFFRLLRIYATKAREIRILACTENPIKTGLLPTQPVSICENIEKKNIYST